MTQPRQEQINTLRANWSLTSYSDIGGAASKVIAAATLHADSITEISGGNANDGYVTRGIITDGYYNLAKLRSPTDGLPITDIDGYVIVGRLTFNGVDYVVSYETIEGIATTLPGLSAISMQMLFPEVLAFGEVPAYASIVDEGGFILGGAAAGGSSTSVFLSMGETIVPGFAIEPGWTVIGSFYLDPSAGISQLIFESIALVSQTYLDGYLRLYDTTASAAVTDSGLAIGNATTDTRDITTNIISNMPTSRIYQVQAECIGGAGVNDYLVVRMFRLFGVMA